MQQQKQQKNMCKKSITYKLYFYMTFIHELEEKKAKIIARLVDALLCCVIILFVVASSVCNKKIPSIIYFFLYLVGNDIV